MLRKDDIDLISGLVEGNLDDESRARALLERSEEARAEYEAQKLAYGALRAAKPVSMTETEKATLHRDLWTALRHDPQPTPAKAPWYQRIAPVAAALFVLVGLGAVLTQGVLNQESGDQAASVDTFAETADGLAGDGAQADAGDTEGAEDTTEAMSADDRAAELAGEAAPLPPSLADAFSEIADEVRTQNDMDDTGSFQSLEDTEEAEESAVCLERAGLTGYSVLGQLEDPSQGETTYLVVVESKDEVGPDTQVFFIDSGACQLAHVER